jgi:hypothetical protein
MREQEVRELYEAYLQVHQPQEEVEQLDEGYQRNPEKDPDYVPSGERPTRRQRMNDSNTGINSRAFHDFMTQQTGGTKKKKVEEETDLFDTILEHLVAEGYADTNEAALAIMANMSEGWREEILDEAITSEKGKEKAAEMIAKRSTPSGRARSGQGASVAAIKHIGRSNREGLGGTPMTSTMAKNPVKKKNYDGTGNRAARRSGEEVEDTRG